MRRLGMLVMAIILITGCNAMKPNMEEAELLWRETEKNIQKWAISANAEASPAEKPQIIPEPTAEIPQKTPASAEKTAPQPPIYTPETKPTEPPQEEPAPTPIPDVPADPVPEPTEPPTEQSIISAPDPTAKPQTGYAECTCGARLTPEEVLPHMKAHALNGESHSYRAY